MASRDGFQDAVHEDLIACDVTGGVEGARAVGAGNGGAVRRILLLEVDKPLCNWRLFDAITDFHAAGGYVTEEIPPLWVVAEGGICNASYEPGNFQEVVYFCEICVGKCVTGEAPENTS